MDSSDVILGVFGIRLVNQWYRCSTSYTFSRAPIVQYFVEAYLASEAAVKPGDRERGGKEDHAAILGQPSKNSR